MPDDHEIFVEASPPVPEDLKVKGLPDRRRRRVAVLVVITAAVGLVAGLWVTVPGGDGHDSAGDVAGHEEDAPVRSWSVPGVRSVAVVGDDAWVLVQGADAKWSVGRLDEGTGDVLERRPVEGSLLQMTASGPYLWIWGQAISAELEEAFDGNRKDVSGLARTGVVDRIDPAGETRRWTLDRVPIFLVADHEQAWAALSDFTNAYTLARFGDSEQVDMAPAPNADRGIVLDGDRIWFNGSADVVAVDRDTGRELERHESRRLVGRTSDGRLWESLSDYRVAEFLPDRGRSRNVLYANGVTHSAVTVVSDGIVIGTRWFEDHRSGPESDAELEVPAGLIAGEPAVAGSGRTVFYAMRPLNVNGPTGAVYRWVPSADRIKPSSRPPLVAVPGTIDLAGCPPFPAAFLTNDAGAWGESTTQDPDLPGVVRRQGPSGAYVQAYPGPAPWLPATPESKVDLAAENRADEYIARTADGYAGRAVLTRGPRAAPCNTLNVIGHSVSREELLLQLDELSNMLPDASEGQMHR